MVGFSARLARAGHFSRQSGVRPEASVESVTLLLLGGLERKQSYSETYGILQDSPGSSEPVLDLSCALLLKPVLDLLCALNSVPQPPIPPSSLYGIRSYFIPGLLQ